MIGTKPFRPIFLIAAIFMFAVLILGACAPQNTEEPLGNKSAKTGSGTATQSATIVSTNTSAPLLTEAATSLKPEISTPTSSLQHSAQEVIVTRDERDLPKGCSPREAAHLMVRFLEAFNSGDQEQFIQFFPPTFQWYSDGWRVGADGISMDPNHLFVSRPGNRGDLPDYLAERHQQEDNLQLLKASVMEEGQRNALIQFQLVREANDVEPGPGGNPRYVNGRAFILCQDQRFFSMGMGIAPPEIQKSNLARMCPEPQAGVTEDAVIACSESIFNPELNP